MCIFCRIINHELPSYVVYEDKLVIAILDINQATYGHTLVMTKHHYDHAWDVPAKEWNHLLLVTQQLSKVVCEKLQADGCNLLTNIYEASGQSIEHCHFHIIPRYHNDDLKLEFSHHQYDLDELLNKLT